MGTTLDKASWKTVEGRCSNLQSIFCETCCIENGGFGSLGLRRFEDFQDRLIVTKLPCACHETQAGLQECPQQTCGSRGLGVLFLNSSDTGMGQIKAHNPVPASWVNVQPDP